MRHFITELEDLQKHLLEMGGLVEDAVHTSVRSLTERDEELAQQVLNNEARINQMEMDNDDLTVRLLALHQPMATDLRFLTVAIKINNDLERMGDLAVNIVERSLSLMKQPLVKPLIDIPRMARLVEVMVRQSLDSFVKRDPELARNVSARRRCGGSASRFDVRRASGLHAARWVNCFQSFGPDLRRTQSGENRRSRHQHRGRRAVPG